MKIVFYLVVLALSVFACKQQTGNSKKASRTWLDAVIKNSDSTYTKPYYRSDFVTASYYLNKKDSSICQVMRDSSGTVRQISIVQKNIRTFFASYYANGQLQAELSLDEFGQYHGSATYYYENGNVQSKGEYSHGLRTGSWKNYDTGTKLISVDEYDGNGQPVKTSAAN